MTSTEAIQHLWQPRRADWLVGCDRAFVTSLINQRQQELANCLADFKLADFKTAKVTPDATPDATTSATSVTPMILIAEADPLWFLAGLLAAFQSDSAIILGNPQWRDREWQQVYRLVQPDLVWGAVPPLVIDFLEVTDSLEDKTSAIDSRSWQNPPLPPQTILIPTGGSSGTIKFAVHTWQTLMAAVAGFQQHFDVAAVNSYCTLPLYHVSGLMQVMRSLISGGQLVLQSFKELQAGQCAIADPTNWFISLVPTQLQRLLQDSSSPDLPHMQAWLAQFQAILLGGGAPWSSLLDRARRMNLPLALTYGMTETAALVAALQPQEFLAGHSHSGRVLPHAEITVHDPAGRALAPGHLASGHLDSGHFAPGQTGLLQIRASSLALGYLNTVAPASTNRVESKSTADSRQAAGSIDTLDTLPTLPSDAPRGIDWFGTAFQPDDIGYLDADGSLHIVGRNSTKIITGGENVFPEEVEATIRATGLVEDVCVIGLPDDEWGQAVTAVYTAPQTHQKHLPRHIQAAIAPQLSRYKQPKRWIQLNHLPRNPQGKINRTEIQVLLQGAL